MANLTKPFTSGDNKFSKETMLVTSEDGAVICSMSPKIPNTRGVMTQTANGYLLAQAANMYKALTEYVEAEAARMSKCKYHGIPHKPSEQYERSLEILKKAVPYGK